jgi:plastocyanin
MRLSTELVLTGVTAIAAAAIMAGCGGPVTAGAAPAPTPVRSEQSMPGMAMGSGSGAAPAQDAPVATNTVSIQDFAFSPAIVTIKAGTTVTWTNRDQDPHTVTAMSGPFHSSTLDTGQSFQHTFTTPGHFDYLCTIHPFMTATVVVTP